MDSRVQTHARQFPFSPGRWGPWRALPDGGARVRAGGRLGAPCGGTCSRLPGGGLAVRCLLARSARLCPGADRARPRHSLDYGHPRRPELNPSGRRIRFDRLLGRRPARRRSRRFPAPCLRGAGQPYGHRHRRPGAVQPGRRGRPGLRRPAGRRRPGGHGRHHPGILQHGLRGERGARPLYRHRHARNGPI